MDEMQQPIEVRLALWRCAIMPVHVVVLVEPVGVVEWQIGEDVVGAEDGALDVAEGVGVFRTEVGLDAASGEFVIARRRVMALLSWSWMEMSPSLPPWDSAIISDCTNMPRYPQVGS